ncbi:hypothetical protein FA13DRAFT_1715920 [Coprinellus micaceus]|uniref:RING-type domain-containing protein n=1 Tax=Coprinellus micaceus TaxID=71717 RepID=A0A4Y7SMW8_COPMI|nr:hypothetical protein FA13DRAFT_1715920 [Coprinellus micaceus]
MIPGCGICYQELHPIDHPACYLPCGHIFCLQCGGRLVSKYPCPFKCTLNSRTRTVRQRDVRSLAISVVPIEGVDEERAVLGAIVAADAKHRATDASACQLAEQNRVQDQRYQVQLSQLSRLGTYVIDSSEKLKGTLLTTRRAYETLRKHDCLRRQGYSAPEAMSMYRGLPRRGKGNIEPMLFSAHTTNNLSIGSGVDRPLPPQQGCFPTPGRDFGRGSSTTVQLKPSHCVRLGLREDAQIPSGSGAAILSRYEGVKRRLYSPPKLIWWIQNV